MGLIVKHFYRFIFLFAQSHFNFDNRVQIFCAHPTTTCAVKKSSDLRSRILQPLIEGNKTLCSKTPSSSHLTRQQLQQNGAQHTICFLEVTIYIFGGYCTIDNRNSHKFNEIFTTRNVQLFLLAGVFGIFDNHLSQKHPTIIIFTETSHV